MLTVKASRRELLDAVSRAARIAPASSTIDVLRGALLQADGERKLLTVTATNLEIALEQEIPCENIQGEDELVVNVKLLAGMLGQLDGDSVELLRLPESNLLSVKSGRAQYTLPTLDRKQFPNMTMPFPEDMIQVSGIASLAKRTVFAVSVNDTVPLMKCVNLVFTGNGLTAVGSDGVCLVTARGDRSSTGDASFLLPAASLDKLARMSSDKDTYRVGTTGKELVFRKEHLSYSARTMEGSYINAKGILGNLKNAFTVLSDLTEMRDKLHSVIAMDPDGRVRLRFDGSRLLFCSDGIYGKASVELTATPLTGHPSGDYWYAAKRLYNSFRALSGTVTLGIAQNGVLTLSTEEAFYIQTALRPPASKTEPPAGKPRKTAA